MCAQGRSTFWYTRVHLASPLLVDAPFRFFYAVCLPDVDTLLSPVLEPVEVEIRSLWCAFLGKAVLVLQVAILVRHTLFNGIRMKPQQAIRVISHLPSLFVVHSI